MWFSYVYYHYFMVIRGLWAQDLMVMTSSMPSLVALGSTRLPSDYISSCSLFMFKHFSCFFIDKTSLCYSKPLSIILNSNEYEDRVLVILERFWHNT